MDPKPHLLLVTYPAQGHINPSLHLCRRLARTTGAHVTFSTTISAHRRMFPSVATSVDSEVHDGLLSHVPFSDGYDDGFIAGAVNSDLFMARFQQAGYRTLSTLVDGLAAHGRPVTCIIYNILMPWAANVASERGISSALLWIQPATVFAIYYHYFNSIDSTFTLNFPWLPTLRKEDLPSFLTMSSPDDPYSVILAALRETFLTLEGDGATRPKVLVNTFQEIEGDALGAIDKHELVPVGPLVPSSVEEGTLEDLYKGDGKGYLAWLETKPERSVVYVSFGTMSTLKGRQIEEILRGLAESGRPYLWTLRQAEGVVGNDFAEGRDGMVVEWCAQAKVLSHRSIGCFVTHCGWNSTMESLVCGVPTVAVPQWSDQTTNAILMVEAWGTGVRGKVDGEGVLEGSELRRCLEVVMGEEDKGVEIRRRAKMWRDKAVEAVKEGGPSDLNLKAFVEEATKVERVLLVDGHTPM